MHIRQAKIFSGGDVARVPEVEIERLKEQVSLVSVVTAHGGAAQDRQGPGRQVPVPRRPDPVAGGDAGQEPVALPGGLSGRRQRRGLGDARGGSPSFPSQGDQRRATSDDWNQTWTAEDSPSADAFRGLEELYPLFGQSVESNPCA